MTWLVRTYETPWMPMARFLIRWFLIGQVAGITAYVYLRYG
jgi:hypothetical protein